MYPPQRFPSGLLVDQYHIDSAYVAWKSGTNPLTTFDLYTRDTPFGGKYLLVAGLDLVLDVLREFQFDRQDLAYLETIRHYDESFLKGLEIDFSDVDIRAMNEGEIAFPNEPMLRLSAPFQQAILLESLLLHLIGVSTLIATKAARIVSAGGETPVAEFGFRRAQAPYLAARSAYIAGCPSTSFLAAGEAFGISTSGTIPHALVELYPDEKDAFQAVASALDNYSLLIDTYDVDEAIELAIEVAAHEKAISGHRLSSVRLDGGDLGSQARSVRSTLDAAGLADVQILASGNLDEWKIADLEAADAPIDGYGVGTALSTGAGSAKHEVDGGALGAVYKLVWIDGGPPPIKVAGDKSTWPGVKQVVREGSFEADVIQLEDERVGEKRTPILSPIQLGQDTSGAESRERLEDARERGSANLEQLSSEYQRLDRANEYPVSWSDRLIAMRDAAVRRVQ